MRGALAPVLAAVLVLGACTGASDDDSLPEDPAEFAASQLDQAETVPIAERATTTTTTPGAVLPTDIRGAIIDQFSLEVGDCFDRVSDLQAGRSVTITSRIDCADPHGFQIFHRLVYPAAHPSIHPGDKIMRDFALQSCYREFGAWVGNEYELSELDIGAITPPRENFENAIARYRGIHCWVERVDGEVMIGDARGSGW